MKKTKIQQELFLIILVSCFILLSACFQADTLYTIQSAEKCFFNQALVQCQNQIHKCLAQKQCQDELYLYHDCDFIKEYPNQIFNGNCFMNWKNTAISSKQVIHCFDSQCNLTTYNSQVSLDVLYKCTAEALIIYNVDCNQQCQQILESSIKSKIPYQPINQIYSNIRQANTSKNQNVENLIQIINKECVAENGSIRKRHQEEKLKKKLNNLKIMKRINKKTQNQPEFDKLSMSGYTTTISDL